MYIVGLYFTYYDDPKEFERTFNNEKRMKYGGMSKQDLRDAQKISNDVRDKYSAPTESEAYKQAMARKSRREGA